MILKYILLVVLLSTIIQANEKLKIGGSSTLFLFSSTVSSIVSVMRKQEQPLVKSSGSSKGLEELCNTYSDFDIINTSRRIKEKEFKKCEQNKINDIIELYIGRNGIVFVQNKTSNELPNITREELFLALAKEIPTKTGKLQKNPYLYWNEINPDLPKRKILIYGHKKTAGIRASFDAIVIKHISNKSKNISKLYKNYGYKNYKHLREDGAFIELNSDKEILEKTLKNKDAIGNLNYLYYSKHREKAQGLSIDGVKPSIKNIENSSYKLTKKLFIYYRKSKKNNNDSLKNYLTAFLSEEAIGDDGILKEIGFIPLSKEKRKKVRNIYKKDILLKNKE